MPLDFAFYSLRMAYGHHTEAAKLLHDFISRFVSKNRYSPSFEEIAGLGLNSLATVHKHVSNLEKKGLLTRDYNRSRSIDLVPPKGRSSSRWRSILSWCCRILGASLPASPSKPSRYGSHFTGRFCSLQGSLRARSSRRFDAGRAHHGWRLRPGRKGEVSHNGDMVVALIHGDETTLKRFHREGDNIRLQPSNANMQPIIVPAAAVKSRER